MMMNEVVTAKPRSSYLLPTVLQVVQHEESNRDDDGDEAEEDNKKQEEDVSSLLHSDDHDDVVLKLEACLGYPTSSFLSIINSIIIIFDYCQQVCIYTYRE